MDSSKHLSSLRQWIAIVATTGIVFLAGCSTSFQSVSGAGDSPSAGISGLVHGGNNPVYGATVKLYEAGYTGYGSAGTLLATTTTTPTGAFSFVKNTGTGTPGSGSSNTYQCDTAHPTALIYIIATGGNTTGAGASTPANSAAAFLSVAGNCNNISSSTVIDMNELVTAATVYAFAQYINPGACSTTCTPGTEYIGTNNTAQAILGLNNALYTFNNLATNSSLSSTTITPPTYTGSNPSVSGVTVTATANSAKLVTIANILSACVNQTSSSASQCVDLFADATPPAGSVTSQPGATFGAAADTVQAAYYLATNPGLNGGSTTCTTTPADTTAASCLYSLASATGAPFQTGLGSAPTDYTLGITYTATGTCTGGGSLISGPYHGNVDASGNLWIVNATATSANLSEISPSGQPLYCGGALDGGRGIAIDANGNVWAAFNGSTTNGIVELPYGSSTLNSMSIGTSAPYTMTADGFGNVFMNVNSGGVIYEWIDTGSGTPPTPVKAIPAMTNYGVQAFVAMDGQGRLWDGSDSTSYLFGVYPNSSAGSPITGFSVSAGTVTFNGANSFSVGNQFQITSLSSTEGSTFDLQTFTVTAATASSFSAATSAANTSGTVTDSGYALLAGSYLYTGNATTSTANTYGLAIDNSNNIYEGTTCCSSGAPYRTLIKWAVSSNGTATPTLSATNVGGINGVRSLAVDGAGNLWVGNEYPSSLGSTPTTGQYAVMEFTTASFTPISPAGSAPTACSTSAGCPTGGGYYDSNINTPFDLDIDPTGNLWILNTYVYASSSTYGATVTELVGAAVPVATPLSVATGSNKLGAKP